MTASSRSESRPHPLFWVLAAFLVLVAFTGGSSRVDVLALLVLRPAAILVCALALITLRRDHLRGRKWLFVGFAAVGLLILLHLVPLPPGIWHALPGRKEIAQSDMLVGMAGNWRPLTLTPINALHSLVSLSVPLAVLLLASQLDRTDLYRLLPWVIAIGALSGFVGLLQLIGAQLDPYSVGLDRGAGGLFANRNHAALMLAMLFPMLAAWVRAESGDPARFKFKIWSALTMAAVLCPLVLVTGSRSGLLLAGFGLISAAIIVRSDGLARAMPRVRWRGLMIALAIVIGFLVLGFATVYFSRAEAIARLFDGATFHDPRFDSWPVSYALLMKYMPLGAGAGSFVEVYMIVEPDAQLNPTYWNHAHNDFLETGITLGIPGIGLILIAAIAFFRRAVPLWRVNQVRGRSMTIARMASVAIAMMALASLTDYPVRTPIMMSIFVLCSLWLVGPPSAKKPTLTPPSSLGLEL